MICVLNLQQVNNTCLYLSIHVNDEITPVPTYVSGKILILEIDIRAGPHVIGVVPVVECQWPRTLGHVGLVQVVDQH